MSTLNWLLDKCCFQSQTTESSPSDPRRVAPHAHERGAQGTSTEVLPCYTVILPAWKRLTQSEETPRRPRSAVSFLQGTALLPTPALHHHHLLCILALVCLSKEKERKPEIQTAATESINNMAWWTGLLCRHIPRRQKKLQSQHKVISSFLPKK